MAQLVVRNLEDDVIQRLRDRAERHGRSIEEEVREILRLAVMSQAEPVEPLGRRFRMLFEGIGLEEDMPEWRGQTTPALAQLQSLITEGIESGVSNRSMDEVLEIAREKAAHPPKP